MSAARYTLLALASSLGRASGFAVIKIACRYAPPLLLMASRFLAAGAGLLVAARLAGARFPATWRERRRITVLGLLNNVCYLGVTALVLAQGGLIVAVSVGAMRLWLFRHGDATRASAWWFLKPVLGLGRAALALDEPLGAARRGDPRAVLKYRAMKTLLVLIMALLAAGCALDIEARAWTKPATMAQQVTADEYGCAHRAFTIGPGPDLVMGGLVDVVRLGVQETRQARAFDGCMASLGYAKVH